MIDLSPEAFRTLGYQAIDLIAKRLAALADTPATQPDQLTSDKTDEATST